MKKRLSQSLAFGLAMAALLLPSCQRNCAHNRLTDQTINATCSLEGKVLHTCLDCGYEYATDIVAPTGHTLRSTVFEPTCEFQGYTTYFCECGYSFSSDYKTPLGHALTATVIPPTCEEQGKTEQVCSRCDYLFADHLTVPLGHRYETESAPVTCTHSGYTHYDCTACDYAYRDYIHYSELVPNAFVENTTALAKGLDISKSNHKIDGSGAYIPLDWTAIRAAGFDYVILKIGSSYSGLDPTFEMNYAGAKAAGLDVGVYFFTYADSVADNIADADQVIEWLNGRQLEYPIYFDIEDDSFDDNPHDQIVPDIPDKNTVTDFCLAFIDRIFEHGYYGALYCNYDWLTYKLDTAKCLSMFDIWYSRYPGTDPSYTVDTVFDWTYGDQHPMWQYTNRGTLESVPGVFFDFNYCYKDFPALMTQYHLNGY